MACRTFRRPRRRAAAPEEHGGGARPARVGGRNLPADRGRAARGPVAAAQPLT